MRLYEFTMPKIKTWQDAIKAAKEAGLIVNNVSRTKKPEYELRVPPDIWDIEMNLRILDPGTVLSTRVKSIPEFLRHFEKIVKSKETLERVKDNPTELKSVLKEKFYDWLQELYSHMEERTSRLKQRPQLYVEKTKHVPDHVKRSWTYDFDDEGNVRDSKKKEYGEDIEEASGLLPGRRDSEKGGRKPTGRQFWTSSAQKNPDGTWTSEWVEYVSSNMPQWHNNKGKIFTIDSKARILVLDDIYNDLEKFIKMYRWYSGETAEIEPKGDLESYDDANIREFPWHLIHKHWDAVHVRNPSKSLSSMMSRGLSDQMTYTWDVESTVWFNPDVLTLKGTVPVKAQGEDDEDY